MRIEDGRVSDLSLIPLCQLLKARISQIIGKLIAMIKLQNSNELHADFLPQNGMDERFTTCVELKHRGDLPNAFGR